MKQLFSKGFWQERDVEMFIGQQLRWGVITASVIAFVGGIIYLANHGGDVPAYHVFNGAPEYVRHLPGIFHGAARFDGMAIIQLGVVVLLATPITRIAFSVVAFAMEKDRLYVVITLLVLSIIIFSIFSGLGG
ncbi:DUF1634 domain-containing protein [Chitinophaga sancti]|uniref:DUF1634 domain-containing protein n=1 Tax=Chitinophaga sancti TaxID=1004 RepID=A0A1K1RXV4_9BACT|nr:DUF1634 domain-containing protein [Chitinophaga sancti]WQD64093.1 DUF1634 domain-containing protein [Chitinophaga sancti]WQG90283.1 DUF1634 domain-containing protein [Chitinophaga sancti]SFW76984.1 Uncharacterized membrane protein [Chitinophaga sancti]